MKARVTRRPYKTWECKGSWRLNEKDIRLAIDTIEESSGTIDVIEYGNR